MILKKISICWRHRSNTRPWYKTIISLVVRPPKEAKDTLVRGGAALIRIQVLCLVNNQERHCPLLHLNLGKLETLLYVDDVGGKKELSCLSKSHILNEMFFKSNHFIDDVP